MAIQRNPSWLGLLALGMLVMGAYIGFEALDRPSEEEEATMARPLRPTTPVGKGRASRSEQAGASLVLLAGGVGLGLYALWLLRRQGELLRDGVPVMGRITRIHRPPKRSAQITYRFKDDQGVVHEGVYSSMIEGSSVWDSFTEGQDVTVVYDPADPSRHLLDVDNVRRADAAVRRL
jgi:hypothetical protein